MNTFTMLVGLPGSGKSTYAEELIVTEHAFYISSDNYREMLLNDINDQSNNQLVFEKMKQDTIDDLNLGINIVYDATNINYKKRMALLQELKSKCNNVYYKCILVACPIEDCIERNDNRDRHVPVDVIYKMRNRFTVPAYYEGWDEIKIHYTSERRYGNIQEFIDKYNTYDQENKHHTTTLGEHCFNTLNNLMSDITLQDVYDTSIYSAAALHDCGKPCTKDYFDSRGNVTDEAHYYNHQHAGCYNSLFYTIGEHESHLQVALFILWHMQPYFWERDNNEKQRMKYFRLWGQELYNKILCLHNADKNAH